MFEANWRFSQLIYFGGVAKLLPRCSAAAAPAPRTGWILFLLGSETQDQRAGHLSIG